MLQHDITLFQQQLQQGAIQRAYRAIFSFVSGLRARYAARCGEAAVSALYQGYLDMTYFAIFPPALKERGLKIAVVFNYDTFQFEAWLAARNRTLQRQVWQQFKDSTWPRYRVVAPAAGIDAILECTLAREFDLEQPDALTAAIEKTLSQFTEDIERFLFTQQSGIK